MLLTGMLANASAQPASGSAPIAPKSESPPNKKIVAPPETATSSASTLPSRHVGEAELGTYLESMLSVFTIKKRLTDPFGQLQDPDAKPIVKPTVVKGPHKPIFVQATPFSDIVRLIKVTTIMPMEKRFLIGNRSISQGQRFPLDFNSKKINVEVVSVSSRQITFRNLDTNETASIDLNLLPAGMVPGAGKITAPGMTQDAPNAPLQLGGGNTSQDNLENR